MPQTFAKSSHAHTVRDLCEGLQTLFVAKLEALSAQNGEPAIFERIAWLRDGGAHGGGHRYVQVQTPLYNRAAVNVSGIHYDDVPEKKLQSADAISTIIHPRHPLAPSVHMHISWTEMRNGTGYYRMMADLNPSIEDKDATRQFRYALRKAAPEQFLEAETAGDRYFHIPALARHRGTTHFYLEEFASGDFERDTELARSFGEAAIVTYTEILRDVLRSASPPSPEQERTQLAYHTAYLFQVLTLDRGTTSGLLVHSQNDLGIMGSLPALVDRELLASWAELESPMQEELVRALIDVLDASSPSHVTETVRLALAKVVREHYRKYPEALDLQAIGAFIPPTVENHS